MNIKSRNFDPAQYGVQKFQEGGEMAAPAEAPVEEAAPAQGGEDPMQQLLMACQFGYSAERALYDDTTSYPPQK